MMCHVISLWLPLALAAAPSPAGWRHDGQGDATHGHLPASWSKTDAAWQHPLSARGNASPVVFGDMVCVTSEPTTLTCVDATTGEVRWTHDNAYEVTLSDSEREAFRAKVAADAGTDDRMLEVRKAIGEVRRALRGSSPPADGQERLAALAVELGELQQARNAIAPFLTPPDKEMIGYASPTPVTDGTLLYASFGHGVVSAFTRDGTRRWAVWLGHAPRPMRGHEAGSSASPWLIDGVLVVPHGELVGLDPKTGAERWRAGPYLDFGTPTVMRVGDVPLVLTPDGRGVDARTGTQLLEGLADVFYSGPTTSGDVAYWVGGHGNDNDPDNSHAVAWQIVPDPTETVRATKLWSRPMPSPRRIYTSPLVRDGGIYTLTHDAELVVLDAETGATRHTLSLRDTLRDVPYPNLSWVDAHLVAASRGGQYAVLDVTGAPRQVSSGQYGESVLGTPWFGPDRVYLRGEHVLSALPTR